MGALLFSFMGRIGRGWFLLASTVLFLGLLVYQYLTGGLWLILLGYAIWGFIQSALLVKRLHDVNRTGWWAVAPAIALAIGAVVFSFVGDSPGTPSALRMVGLSIPMACGMGFALGFIAWVGSKAGSSRANRFGEAPDYGVEY